MPRYGALSKLELFPEINIDNVSNFVFDALNSKVEIDNNIQKLTLEYNIETAKAATLNQIYDQLSLTPDLISQLNEIEKSGVRPQLGKIKAKFFSEIESLLE